MSSHRFFILPVLLAAATSAGAASSSDDEHGARYRLAMRALGVREALSEMLDDSNWDQQHPELFFEERHVAPPPGARPVNDDWEDFRVPVGVQGQDLVFQEQFVIAGREDDFEDAADKWVQRKLKGSDRAKAARGRHSLSPKFAWDGGPVVGLQRGKFTVMGGENQLHAKWTQPFNELPGWYARFSAGTEDGENQVAFLIGRSLLHATTRSSSKR